MAWAAESPTLGADNLTPLFPQAALLNPHPAWVQTHTYTGFSLGRRLQSLVVFPKSSQEPDTANTDPWAHHISLLGFPLCSLQGEIPVAAGGESEEQGSFSRPLCPH